MGLSADELEDVDDDLLDYLNEGRITSTYARDRLLDADRKDVTSSFLGERLQRLAEHGHVENLYDTGLYELIDDPRSEAPIDLDDPVQHLRVERYGYKDQLEKALNRIEELESELERQRGEQQVDEG